jgi:hypothetical protein
MITTRRTTRTARPTRTTRLDRRDRLDRFLLLTARRERLQTELDALDRLIDKTMRDVLDSAPFTTR